MPHTLLSILRCFYLPLSATQSVFWIHSLPNFSRTVGVGFMAPPPPPPPLNLKPPRSKSFLQPRSQWKGKIGTRKQIRKRNANPNTNSNPNLSRRKQQTGKVGWLHDHAYHPPRLQDLQFQNRLKAFRHFEDRFNTAGYSSRRSLLVDGLIASASGFSMPPPRIHVADVHTAGLPLNFPGQGRGFTGSLAYPGKGKATMSDFLITNSQYMIPRNMPFTTKLATSLLPGVSLPSFSTGATLNFRAASHDHTGKGDVCTSSATPVVPMASKGSVSFKHYKASRRTRKAILAGHKGLGAPAAPRNTTSFLMRAKKAGGITSFVSPSPATSAVTPAPVMSPFETHAGHADNANHEWGVNDYGSMNGLIRLRSLDFGLFDYGDHADSESEVEQGVEAVQQLEQRLDHDVSRFVLTYPSNRGQDMGQNILETSMEDQDSHIAHLEEENLDLKSQLYSMQQEARELRRRVRVLEGAASGDEAEAECSAEVSPERNGANVSCV